MYIISGCLLGENCKYNGGNNYNEKVIRFCQGKNIFSVCPEMSGGLEAPRPPVERIGDKAINTEGKDVTSNFVRGALFSYAKAKERAASLGEEIEGAILKWGSPSCGSNEIYDGTFTHTVISGDGVFAELLKENGINVITEKDI